VRNNKPFVSAAFAVLKHPPDLAWWVIPRSSHVFLSISKASVPIVGVLNEEPSNKTV
jgi:hypothetical protein